VILLRFCFLAIFCLPREGGDPVINSFILFVFILLLDPRLREESKQLVFKDFMRVHCLGMTTTSNRAMVSLTK
jgi:hypothetical protein